MSGPGSIPDWETMAVWAEPDPEEPPVRRFRLEPRYPHLRSEGLRSTRATRRAEDDCGCTYEEGTYFPCLRHMTPHPHDGTKAPGCRACQEDTELRIELNHLTPGDT